MKSPRTGRKVAAAAAEATEEGGTEPNRMPASHLEPKSPSPTKAKRSKSKAAGRRRNNSKIDDDHGNANRKTTASAKNGKTAKNGRSGKKVAHARSASVGAHSRGRERRRRVSPEDVHGNAEARAGSASPDASQTRMQILRKEYACLSDPDSSQEPKRRGRRNIGRQSMQVGAVGRMSLNDDNNNNNNDDDDDASVISTMTMETAMTTGTGRQGRSTKRHTGLGRSAKSRSVSAARRVGNMLAWPLKKNKPKPSGMAVAPYGMDMSSDDGDDEIMDDDDDDDVYSVRSSFTAPVSMINSKPHNAGRNANPKRKVKSKHSRRMFRTIDGDNGDAGSKQRKVRSRSITAPRKKNTDLTSPLGTELMLSPRGPRRPSVSVAPRSADGALPSKKKSKAKDKDGDTASVKSKKKKKKRPSSVSKKKSTSNTAVATTKRKLKTSDELTTSTGTNETLSPKSPRPKSVVSIDTTATPTSIGSAEGAAGNELSASSQTTAKEPASGPEVAGTSSNPSTLPNPDKSALPRPANENDETNSVVEDEVEDEDVDEKQDEDAFIKSVTESTKDVIKAEREVSSAREQCLAVWESELKEREDRVQTVEEQSKRAMKELDTYFCSIKAARLATTQYGANNSLQQRQDAVESIEKVLSQERNILRQQRIEFESQKDGVYVKYQKLQEKHRVLQDDFEQLQQDFERMQCRVTMLEEEEMQHEQKQMQQQEQTCHSSTDGDAAEGFLKGEYEILKKNYETAQQTIEEQDDEILVLKRHIQRIENPSMSTSFDDGNRSQDEIAIRGSPVQSPTDEDHKDRYKREIEELENERDVVLQQHKDQIENLLKQLEEKNACIDILQSQLEQRQRRGMLGSSSHHSTAIGLDSRSAHVRGNAGAGIGGFLSQMTPKGFRATVSRSTDEDMKSAIGPLEL